MRPTVKFGFQFFAAAAGSGAERTTGLRHKTVDHAMKFQPVVKSRAHQFLDPRHMVRRIVGKHLNHHVAVFQFKQQRVLRVFNLIFCLFFLGPRRAFGQLFGVGGFQPFGFGLAEPGGFGVLQQFCHLKFSLNLSSVTYIGIGSFDSKRLF